MSVNHAGRPKTELGVYMDSIPRVSSRSDDLDPIGSGIQAGNVQIQ